MDYLQLKILEFRQRTFLSMQDDYDINFGRHSNIPDCCIFYFITQTPAQAHARLMDEWNGNYLPCDECLRTLNVKRVHFCGSKCKRIPFIAEHRRQQHRM